MPEQLERLDLLIDEASMLSFPASDPPAIFRPEPEPTPPRTSSDDPTSPGDHEGGDDTD